MVLGTCTLVCMPKCDGCSLHFCFWRWVLLVCATVVSHVHLRSVEIRGEQSWEPLEHLQDCQAKLTEFLQRMRTEEWLPVWTDPEHLIVAGGPPCQGVSPVKKSKEH